MQFTGHALDQGWQPHKPESWPFRFASLVGPLTMKHFRGHGPAGPQFDEVDLAAGSTVKIVMVSRFGDVGITDKLDAETGYGARVQLDALTDYRESA